MVVWGSGHVFFMSIYNHQVESKKNDRVENSSSTNMFPIDLLVDRKLKWLIMTNDKQPGKHRKVPCFKQLWLVLSVKLMEINVATAVFQGGIDWVVPLRMQSSPPGFWDPKLSS